MNNKKIQQLKKRYLKFYKADPVSEEELDKVERSLNVILPSDFKEIAKVFYGDTLGGYDIYAFAKNDDSKSTYNIVDQTLILRKKINFPPQYIPLYEQDDSFIYVKTQDKQFKSSPVIYCDIVDVFNIAEGKPINEGHRYFPSFTDFFEWLIEKEEEMRAEEAQNSYP